MRKKDAVLTVRIDSETKHKAEVILRDIGLDYSKAINIFLNQVIIHNGIPFEISTKKK